MHRYKAAMKILSAIRTGKEHEQNFDKHGINGPVFSSNPYRGTMTKCWKAKRKTVSKNEKRINATRGGSQSWCLHILGDSKLLSTVLQRDDSFLSSERSLRPEEQYEGHTQMKKVKEYECKRAVLVGHNAHFDLGFMNAAIERNTC